MTLRPYALAALLALVLGTGCTIDLQHELTEQDANEIYVLLSKNGIAATKLKEEGGNELRFRIQVPKADAAQAAELLRAYSLPRPMEAGLNHFAKGGMVPTATEERAMMLKSLGGEVSNALNQIDGVLEARVIVMIPENNDLTQPENKPLPSASVFIKYRPGPKNEPPIKREDIQQFVATAVPELKPTAVTVLLTPAIPPDAEVGPESRLQDVMGMRMTASSLSQFRMMAAVAVLLILASIGLAAWPLIRGSGGASAARARAKRD
ncbi:type III secretion protein [Cystobacter ferrugineus]|uniref:Type III secretion protein n=1 Tax=Cystobacter ferrugineus TaxID=83449 RepID=A0A1L9BAR7_9BACT|nr:type III secretion protein [Cystobacter ferrugineus]OJH39318.1 type III secretion protein [Cystobacter ferrugineus]